MRKFLRKLSSLIVFFNVQHIWHDDCFCEINLWILLNNIMKKFQVKHGQCDSIISPKPFSFESSKWLLDLCLAGCRIFDFSQVLESIYKLIIELQQSRGRIISDLQNLERPFHLLWQPCDLRGNLTMWSPFLHHLKKVFLCASVFKRRKYTCTLY